MNLRPWQMEAMQVYYDALASGRSSLLVEATPGAGKTKLALAIGRHQTQELGRRRIVAVVPTRHLKKQWSDAGRGNRVRLAPDFRAGQHYSSGNDGIVVTYQQLAQRPEYYRDWSRGAAVILDEIHHAGDGLSWGKALREAFAEAAFVLCLSGTAFRRDSATIPFVTYQNGESTPDYVYPYGRAVLDGICRPLAFVTYGGEVGWKENTLPMSAAFTADAGRDDQLAARRLIVALEPETGWIQPMLADAHTMLMEIRREHPAAGGLIIGMDVDHTRRLAAALEQTTGVVPVVALSDDKESSDHIDAFADGRQPWLVACQMVSEGVDIPRLRVGVYATNITAALHFRQFLGRLVRMTPQPAGPQPSYCYLPADSRLEHLAGQVEDELRHVLGEGVMVAALHRKRGVGGGIEEIPWSPTYATNSGVEAVIVGGRQLDLFGEVQARPVQLHQQVAQYVVDQPAEVVAESKTLAELRREVKRVVGIYCRQSGRAYEDVYAELNRRQQVNFQAACTEAQLRKRIEIVERWIR